MDCGLVEIDGLLYWGREYASQSGRLRQRVRERDLLSCRAPRLASPRVAALCRCMSCPGDVGVWSWCWWLGNGSPKWGLSSLAWGWSGCRAQFVFRITANCLVVATTWL